MIKMVVVLMLNFLKVLFKFSNWMKCVSYVDSDSKWHVLTTCLQILHLGLLQESYHWNPLYIYSHIW